MGQITPGPILISATFTGYKVAGLAGATAANVGIFLPPALLMTAAPRVLDYIKTHNHQGRCTRREHGGGRTHIFRRQCVCQNRTTELGFAGDLRRRADGPVEDAYRGALDHTRCGFDRNGAVLM